MSPSEALSAGITAGGIGVAFPAAFLGGLLSAFNPCCFPMLPTVVALVGNHSRLNKVRGAIISAFFVLGFAITTAALGAVSASIGLVFGRLGSGVSYALAFIPIAMGLHLLGVVNLRIPVFSRPGPDREGHIGALTTGIVYAMILVPCATPILGTILTVAAYRAEVVYGAGLLFTYGVGAGIPLIIMGSFMGLLGTLHLFETRRRMINRLTAVTLIGAGLYLLWAA